MNCDPQKFFIGLMEFFTILLPGALLTCLLMCRFDLDKLGASSPQLANAEAWATFLFASYLFGHLVFLVSSWLDEFYDWTRRHTLNAQIKRLALRNDLLPWPVRALIWLVFKGERNLAVEQAKKIKEHELSRLHAKDAINTFQWCKVLLNVESPQNLAVVQRFEADSKFFRCLTVVMLLLLVACPVLHATSPEYKWSLKGLSIILLLLLLALWRYMEQRFKATNQAYWSVITLKAREGKISHDKSIPAAGSPTHAGGVVLRLHDGTVECLLVEAKDDPTVWVLPKGHVEEGEQHRETAIREVYEETGVWAGIIGDLDDVPWTVQGTAITTRFYLMKAMGCGIRKDKDRRPKWLTLPQAVGTEAIHKDTRELLGRPQVAQTAKTLLDEARKR